MKSIPSAVLDHLVSLFMRMACLLSLLVGAITYLNATEIISPNQPSPYITPPSLPIACGDSEESGDYHPKLFPVRVRRDTQFILDFDMYTIPDKLYVEYAGQIMATTGSAVSNTGTLAFPLIYNPNYLYVHIKVLPSSDQSTAWRFKYHCQNVATDEPSTENPSLPGDLSCLTTSTGNSIIDDVQMDHWHEAVDYEVAQQEGCTPCQTGMNQSGSMDAFALKRLHRYRYMDRVGSFGPGVFCNFDTRMTLDSAGAWAEVFDPLTQTPLLLSPSVNPGEFVDAGRGLIKRLYLTDSGGAAVNVPQRGNMGHLEYWDGRIEEFEVFEHVSHITSNATEYEKYGRLTRRADVNGRATKLTYQHLVTAAPSSLDNNTDNFWKIATVIDAYGSKASFVYAYSAGAPVVSHVNLPNGFAVDYHYDQNGMVGLSGIDYPTGEHAVFSAKQDEPTYQQLISIFDPGAAGIHRAKTLYLSSAAWGYNPNSYRADGIGYNTPSNRIRKVVNGNGEISYQSWVKKVPIDDPAASQGITHQIFVFTGGNQGAGVLKRLDQANSLTKAVYKSRSGMTGFEPEDPMGVTWDLQESFEFDAHSRAIAKIYPGVGKDVIERNETGSPHITTKLNEDGTAYSVRQVAYNAVNQPLLETDSLGRKTRYEYNGPAGSPTAITHADGTAIASITRASYNAQGQIVSSTDANGHVTDYEYDPNGYVTDVYDPPDVLNGPRAHHIYRYGAGGLVTSTVDPDGREVFYQHDGRNRLILTSFADGTSESVAYGTGDYANLPVLSKDRNGNSRSYVYDLGGRKVAETLTSPTGEVARQQSWTYVPGSNLIANYQDGSFIERYRHDQRNRIIEIERPAEGRAWTEYSMYDASDRLVRSTDRFGCSTWHLFNRDGQAVRTARELVGNHPLGENPDLAHLSFISSGTANPAWVLEENGFDSEGQMVRQVNERGIENITEFDALGRVSAHVDANRVIDASGNGTALSEAARTEYDYDAMGNMVATRLPRHFVRSGAGFTLAAQPCVTQTAYNGRNLQAKVTRGVGTADASSVLTTYTLSGSPLTVSDPRNPLWLTTNGYSTCCNRLTSVTDPLGFVTTMTYDGNGNVVSTTDANLILVATTYDARNRQRFTTNGAQEITTNLYDDDLTDGVGFETILSPVLAKVSASRSDLIVRGLILPTGEMVVSGSNRFGEPVFQADASGNVEVVARSFDAVVGGQLVMRTNALNEVTKQLVTGSGTTRTMIDAVGFTTTVLTDASGKVLSIRDAAGLGEDQVYDGLGRLVSTTDTHGDTTAWFYDAGGLLGHMRDAKGQMSYNSYDALDRKVSETDFNGATTTFSYSLADDLLSIRDAEGDVTTYLYSERHELVSETFPGLAGGSRSYTYDPGRRKKTVTDQRLIVTTMVYDDANRLKRRDHSDGPAEIYAFDHTGRVTSAEASRYTTTVTRHYDAAGRLNSEVQATPEGSSTIGYEYDLLNRVSNLVLPDGRKIGRSYTKRGEVNSGTLPGGPTAFTRTFDASGRLSSTTYGNAHVESRTYGSKWSLPDAIATALPGQGPILDLRYAWDANRRKLAERDAAGDHEEQSFDYDPAGRLTTWSRSPGDLGSNPPAADQQKWDLSPVGDWKSITTNGVKELREHNAVHEVVARGGVSIAYDLNGNLRSEPSGNRYAWDAENRLTDTLQYTEDGARDSSYRYDALGRRLSKSVLNKTTRFVLNGTQVMQEIDQRRQLSLAELGSDGLIPGDDEPTPDGAVLDGPGVRRVNFQPVEMAIPRGFIADKGRALGTRTNDMVYGWTDANGVPVVLSDSSLIVRDFHPLPQFDTMGTPMDLAAGPSTATMWRVQLPNGSYPVVVVAGDAISRERTNNLVLNGQSLVDLDPAGTDPTGYLKGDFDGWIQQVEVTDGELVWSADSGAVHPAMCFVEIGKLGTQVTAAMRDRLASIITAATNRTAGAPASGTAASPRTFVYGSYIDEPLMVEVGMAGVAQRYYLHTNSLYSVQAVTDSTGAIVEQYTYSAYGDRKIVGSASSDSAIGLTVGFTGLRNEGDLVFARNRYLSPFLGRWISRDPSGYVDGQSLYMGYFIPNGNDPQGLRDQDPPVTVLEPVVPVVTPVARPSREEIAKLLAKAKALVAGGRKYGLNMAADNLEYWLAGNGGTRVIDAAFLRKFASVTAAEAVNEGRFSFKLREIAKKMLIDDDKTCAEFNDHWDRLIKSTSLTEKDLYFGSGNSTLSTKGQFKFVMTGSGSGRKVEIHGLGYNHWRDTYDWNKGSVVFIGDTMVHDDDFLKLKAAGIGKDFELSGDWTRSYYGIYDASTYKFTETWTGP